MQQLKLELLAPAKTSDIGIAAIDCGADAVYIAGPGFGARAAAGNPVSDIARLTDYAYKFSARIYATVNTIVYENELEAVQRMIWELYEAGVDALIVQDLGITSLDLPPIELHASTQCAIRTPEKAAELASLGFKRLILERQLSLEEIRAIHAAVPDVELEFFVHGAICVCYSGNCYLSQHLAGRSANRGACIQACRSLYDVVDADGKVLARERAILSPRDYCLDGRLEELADAGVCSFKIEGRLKNDSYVKNLCRHYSGRLDEICARRPEYIRASSGTLEGGFTPNPAATFNRGYTEFFIGGTRSRWNSLESTKSLGEYIGTVESVASWSVIVKQEEQNNKSGSNSGRQVCEAEHQSKVSARRSKACLQPEPGKGNLISNGDGLVFVGRNGLVGMRADVVSGNVITVKDTAGISVGDKVYRNYNTKFEKELQANMPRRKIDVGVVFGANRVTATDADGYSATLPLPEDAPVAEKQEAAADNIRRNMGKRTGHFDFRCDAVEQTPVRFYPASTLNTLRRSLAEELERARIIASGSISEGQVCEAEHQSKVSARRSKACPQPEPGADYQSEANEAPRQASRRRSEAAIYTANCANHLAKEVLEDLGYESVEEAYELNPSPDAELMRSRYCIKYELGLCPKLHPAQKVKEPLALVNAGRKLKLSFDCKNCEMVVSLFDYAL